MLVAVGFPAFVGQAFQRFRVGRALKALAAADRVYVGVLDDAEHPAIQPGARPVLVDPTQCLHTGCLHKVVSFLTTAADGIGEAP